MVSAPGSHLKDRLSDMGLLSPIDPEAYSRWRPAPRLESIHGRVGGFLGNRKSINTSIPARPPTISSTTWLRSAISW